jgi:hypothetical protein
MKLLNVLVGDARWITQPGYSKNNSFGFQPRIMVIEP